MVLYFSGTGNSRYVAQRICAALGESCIDLSKRIKDNDTSAIEAGERLIFVTPTYGWRVPRIVSEHIEKTWFSGGEKAWFVMTCGSEIGNAAKYSRALCEKKGFEYMGSAQIVMPENYIAMFNAPEKDEARKIVEKAQPDIAFAIECLKNGESFPAPRNNICDRFMSSAVNPVFFALIVKAGPFRVLDGCVGCGKCVALCPTNNIKIVDGRPVWGGDCTHCMACICYCPKNAVEYGRKSLGKPRYNFEALGL